MNFQIFTSLNFFPWRIKILKKLIFFHHFEISKYDSAQKKLNEEKKDSRILKPEN